MNCLRHTCFEDVSSRCGSPTLRWYVRFKVPFLQQEACFNINHQPFSCLCIEVRNSVSCSFGLYHCTLLWYFIQAQKRLRTLLPIFSCVLLLSPPISEILADQVGGSFRKKVLTHFSLSSDPQHSPSVYDSTACSSEFVNFCLMFCASTTSFAISRSTIYRFKRNWTMVEDDFNAAFW